jgi:Ca2+-transporting ATPase
MLALARHNVLARRLTAVERIGNVHVLCFDKTGTLTWNRMSAVAVYAGAKEYSVGSTGFLSGGRAVPAGELSKLLEVCWLCSDATIERREDQWEVDGSPTEVALVRMALNAGVDVAGLHQKFPILETRSRTESQAYMATMHQIETGRVLIAVKGSPEEVLKLCDQYVWDGGVHHLGRRDRTNILSNNARMGARGLRVLGAAYQETAPAGSGLPRLIWLGLTGLADPPRHGLKEVIAEFRRAGIRPLMLTGDQAATAEAVAEAVALDGGTPSAVDALELGTLDANAVRSLVSNASVFSRESFAQIEDCAGAPS